jgi:hypothetical protein
VDILLNHGADIEAQSERTKDTPLSLACSGGRYEVVEILLSRGANKEHRNVSDYTPLSLAASGGYTNIIKLLLAHGAEINSRTGSKLGISPLMLAAMNGHTAAVKLLLDMGSDINAQIETNRNTALTLACFQVMIIMLSHRITSTGWTLNFRNDCANFGQNCFSAQNPTLEVLTNGDRNFELRNHSHITRYGTGTYFAIFNEIWRKFVPVSISQTNALILSWDFVSIKEWC